MSELRYGVAMAAFQVEGAAERGESIWDTFCRVPGAVRNGDTGDVACDHYHRWAEDLDLMAELGIESYRFSISWPRVLPDGTGTVNQTGLDFYKRLVAGLMERGIQPIATLEHWDLPQTLQEAGGWPARWTCDAFVSYAELLARELGAQGVRDFITHNEPWVVAFLGHAEGIKAPGQRDWPAALRASHHLLLSHGEALPAIRAAAPGARVGITLNLAPIRPATTSHEDCDAAVRRDGHMNRWFLDPLLRGAYPDDMLQLYERRFGPFDAVHDGDLEAIARPIDFLGVNYYAPEVVEAAPRNVPLGCAPVPPDGPTTAMGWRMDPDGLREVLGRLRTGYRPVPIYITENGAAFDDPAPNGEPFVDDPERTAYLRGHMGALRRAIAEGSDVRQYCVWSLLDNFEWEHGYEKRFGIVHVDFATQRRRVKRSALWYRDHIKAARED
jgi:beta-glucosidase